MKERSERNGSRGLLHKALRWSVIGLVSLAGLYLVGGNLVLKTGLISKLFRRPEKTLVVWDSAWTLLPGQVHVEGLRIRGQTRKMQWQCRLEQGDFRISLLQLVRKKVHISSADGNSFDFRLRPRLTAETQDDPRQAFFPEIVGFSNPPNPAPEDIYTPKKHKKRGWHIQLTGARFVGPMELWIGGLRMRGVGTVGGDLDFLIRESLQVPHMLFDLDDGVLSLDGEDFARGLHIDVDGQITPFLPKETRGTAIFNHILGGIGLKDGEIPDLAMVNAFLPTSSSLRIASGSGSLDFDFDKASIEEGSHGRLLIAGDDIDMTIAGRDVAGDIDLSTDLVRGSLAEASWVLGETTLALEDVDMGLAGEQGVAEAGTDSQGEAAMDDAWWARFRLRGGKINFGQPSQLHAQFDFSLKNTDPLLELFFAKPKEGTEELQLPGWMKLVPDIKNVEGSADIAMTEASTIVDDVVIEGDKFVLLARLKSEGAASIGNVYLRYKGLDIGLDMKDGKKDLKVLRPRAWFLEQPEFDDAYILEPPGLDQAVAEAVAADAARLPEVIAEPAVEAAPDPEGEGEPETVPSTVPEPLSVRVPPHVLESAIPVYPPAARRLGRGDTVIIEVLVGSAGEVLETRIGTGATSDLGFDKAALTAAAKTTFRPGTQDGVATEMWTEVRFVFSP